MSNFPKNFHAYKNDDDQDQGGQSACPQDSDQNRCSHEVVAGCEVAD
jgi:hypothetical protein